MGVLGALAFIETPLKFQAPGMTLELALGLGRLVLTAAEIATAVLLTVLTAASVVRPRVSQRALVALGSLWAVLLVQMIVVRPRLNHRTDLVLAGIDPGSSPLHGIYVAMDVALLALIVAYIWAVARTHKHPVANP